VAKRKRKPRTPAPPRRAGGDGAQQRVQAPQLRKKTTAPEERARRQRILLYALGGSGVVALAVVVIVIFATGGKKGTPSDLNVDFSELAGINHGPPPWPVQLDDLGVRLGPLGLKPLPQEALEEHIHQHLDIYVDGKRVPVPASIGINGTQFITELHTHDKSGLIHVEAEKARPYSLGQFFGAWGLFLSKRCIGGECAKPGTPLRFYVNGKRYLGDPVTLVLKPHDEIAIVYGKPPKHVPARYDFPSGT